MCAAPTLTVSPYPLPKTLFQLPPKGEGWGEGLGEGDEESPRDIRVNDQCRSRSRFTLTASSCRRAMQVASAPAMVVV